MFELHLRRLQTQMPSRLTLLEHNRWDGGNKLTGFRMLDCYILKSKAVRRKVFDALNVNIDAKIQTDSSFPGSSGPRPGPWHDRPQPNSQNQEHWSDGKQHERQATQRSLCALLHFKSFRPPVRQHSKNSLQSDNQFQAPWIPFVPPQQQE